MKTITPITVLDYYDGIQIFTATDEIGGNYLATMVGTVGDHGRYLVTGVSPSNLRRFRCGEIDLRTLLLASPPHERFTTVASGKFSDALSLTAIGQPLEYNSLLPDEGFFLEEEPVQDALVSEAKLRNNLILEIITAPPESAAGHRMRANTLGNLILHIQRLVRYAYRAEIRSLRQTYRRILSIPHADLMDVTEPAAAGSYRIVMEPASPTDMFGHSELSRAMERIDRVFATGNDPATARQNLAEHKGHLAGSYIQLMRLLAATETGLRYRWATSDSDESRDAGVTRAQAKELADVLETAVELSTEEVTVRGKLEQANDRSGTWCIVDYDGNRHYGKVEDPGDLDGLTIGTAYEFECVETIDTDASGRERRSLSLNNPSPLFDSGN
ncbi:MAG: hypothetical protein OXF79_13350 [Chloroflexi bacterium]|nr:hypothetical protein [Chloroflexota bacterium]